jgi:hypothetical protein
MTSPTSAPGWDDLVAVFRGAGLPVPPVPEDLRPELSRLEEWMWSTQPIERWDLYDPYPFLRDLTLDGPDRISMAHVGQGVNSYFLTIQAIVGPVAVFAQVGWGGAYMDSASRAAELADQYRQVEDLLEAARAWPAAGRPGQRLAVVWGRAKGFDTCVWVALDETEPRTSWAGPRGGERRAASTAPRRSSGRPWRSEALRTASRRRSRWTGWTPAR